MKTGKASESVLKRSVFKQLHTKRDEVISAVGTGLDAAVLKLDADEMTVLSTNPVMGTLEELGGYGVLSVVSNLAAAGATPVGILLTILLPEKEDERTLKKIVAQAQEVCNRYQIQILGGHTEVTKAVNQPVLSLVAVGKAKKDSLCLSKGAKPGMDILIANWIALEGTLILAAEKEQELLTRYTAPFLDKTKALKKFLDIQKAAQIAAGHGVGAMKDGSRGGIFGTLWEFAEASGIGLEIGLKKIPIRQETVEVCEFLGVNPYELHAGGCLLMAAEDGNALVQALEREGIFATVIGKATAGNDRVLLNEEERRFLEPAKPDELLKYI